MQRSEIVEFSETFHAYQQKVQNNEPISQEETEAFLESVADMGYKLQTAQELLVTHHSFLQKRKLYKKFLSFLDRVVKALKNTERDINLFQ